MSHVYHQDLPGFVAGAVLHTGCPECEHRGADLAVALSHFDHERVALLWDRAAHDYYWGSFVPADVVAGATYGTPDSDFRQLIVDPLEQQHFPLIQSLQRLVQRSTLAREQSLTVAAKSHTHLIDVHGIVVPAWLGETSPAIREKPTR